MRIDEAILIMENERPHCGDKLTFTEEERYEAYTLALMALICPNCGADMRGEQNE